MTDTDTIERRLRRTFEAVAQVPIVAGATDFQHQTDRPPGPSRRRTGLLIAAAVVFVVVIGSVALVYGPRNSAPGSRRPVAAEPGRGVTAFIPSGTWSLRELTDDAKILTRRLASLGDGADTAVVKQARYIVVIGGRRLPVPGSVLASLGILQFRHALCASAPFTPPAPGIAPSAMPTGCSSPVYSLAVPNRLVNTATGTSELASIPLDPSLAAVPTTPPASDDFHPFHPPSTVLVPLNGGGGERYLLGPVELSGNVVGSAHAVHRSGTWVVDASFTDLGSRLWDSLAQKYFHQIVALDLDGHVVSAPVTEPSQDSFSSFSGRVQITGSFTEQSAEDLSAVLESGPLATPLELVTRKTVITL
jgi:hypothetical protein